MKHKSDLNLQYNEAGYDELLITGHIKLQRGLRLNNYGCVEYILFVAAFIPFHSTSQILAKHTGSSFLIFGSHTIKMRLFCNCTGMKDLEDGRSCS